MLQHSPAAFHPPRTLTGSGAEWAPFMPPILNPNTSVSFCGCLFVSRERGEVAPWGGGGVVGGRWVGAELCVCVNVPVFNNRLADDDDADVLKL